MNRTIYKIITPSVRKTLDYTYRNQSWYQLIRKNKWDELAYPTSQKFIDKMNPNSRKNFYRSHIIIDN